MKKITLGIVCASILFLSGCVSPQPVVYTTAVPPPVVYVDPSPVVVIPAPYIWVGGGGGWGHRGYRR